MATFSLTDLFGIANVIIPRKGPKVIPAPLDFSVYNSVEVDSTMIMQQNKVDVIQGAFIDNGSNPDPLELRVNITNQRIKIKPFTQGYYAILIADPMQLIVSTPSAPNKVVPFLFYNVPIQSHSWETQ